MLRTPSFSKIFWLVPIASVVALGMAYYFFRSMMSADEDAHTAY